MLGKRRGGWGRRESRNKYVEGFPGHFRKVIGCSEPSTGHRADDGVRVGTGAGVRAARSPQVRQACGAGLLFSVDIV